jgi:SpoVK/Ycf46/Vps4 family AAA+-type ATPase/S1-C subfamily serine protease
MTQPDYSQLITERVHEGLNFNRNHRFFLVYGKLTADEFLTRSMYRTNLRKTLWATLKLNKIERVIFYNAAEKFFFLDEESSRLARRLGRDPACGPEVSAVGSRSHMQRGPLGRRDVLTRPTRMVAPAIPQTHQSGTAAEDPQTPDGVGQNSANEAVPPQEPGAPVLPVFIRMTRARGAGGGMSDAAVLDTLNDFIQDSAIRTALVIEELENLSVRFQGEIRDQLATRLKDWNSLTAENRNVLVFITNREPVDEHSIRAMKDASESFSEIANLVNVALGERRAAAEGFIWYIPPPYEREIERLIDEVRLKHGIPVDWEQRQRVVQWLAAENLPFKHLDGLINEYVNHFHVGGEKISLELIRKQRWITSDADPRPAMERLSGMIGMRAIKTEVDKHIDYLQAEKKKRELNPELRSSPLNLHLVLTGNPGTGKTTVARLIGEVYRDLGLLRRGHTVECDRSKLVGEYEGHTGPKTNARINEALDGVLFIDEAYALKREGEDRYGKEAVDTLVARMENERDRLAVIVAGYPAEMQRFIASNPGMSGRFPTKISIEDYQPEDLLQIFEQMIAERAQAIGDEMRGTMRGFFTRMYELRGDQNYFGIDEHGKSDYHNARTVRDVVEAMSREQAHRLSGDFSPELTIDDIPESFRKFLGDLRPDENSAEELRALMAELNLLIGLQPVKRLVEKLVMEQQLAISLGSDMTASDKTRHMLFTGNPGTGKTTVARLIGRIYKALGILRKGHFIEANHTELVGQYVGETAQKTKRVIESALDGILFIDEAYSLADSDRNGYGLEAINTLVPALENYRNRLVVIFAGYTREMEGFVGVNPGIESRVPQTIEFPDYSGDELLQIFVGMASAKSYTVPEDVREELRRQFDWISVNSGQQFGNARGVRVKFFDRMVEGVEKRMFEAVKAGEDIKSYPRIFLVSDVPEVVAKNQIAIPSSGRTYNFRISEIADAQQQVRLSGEQDIPEAVGKAVGLIKTDKASGTGFVISPKGHLLTSYHVVKGAGSIRFRLSGSSEFREAVYLDGDKDADLVILKVDGRDLPYTRLVAPGYPLRRGTMLGLLGYPLGERLGTEVTYTSGPLSSTRHSAEGVSLFQIDVSAYHGNSGGPVFISQTGEVIGVLKSGPNDTMNFAVSLEELYQRFR